MEYRYRTASPLGEILLASNGTALTGLWFEGQLHAPAVPSGPWEEKRVAVLEQAARWLALYFAGREPDFTPPLAPHGTAFQKAVWEILLTIPYGETLCYGEIAARIAARRGATHMSAQAVGGAVGRNPISLVIPCHRVVGADGSLTGYAGGLERKKRLLELEGSLPQRRTGR